MDAFLEQLGKPLSLGTLCSATFGLFAFIETLSAPQARADFTRYLELFRG